MKPFGKTHLAIFKVPVCLWWNFQFASKLSLVAQGLWPAEGAWLWISDDNWDIRWEMNPNMMENDQTWWKLDEQHWWKHDVRNEWNHSQTFLGKNKWMGHPKVIIHAASLAKRLSSWSAGRARNARFTVGNLTTSWINWVVQVVQENIYIQETIPSLYLWTQRLPIESCRVPLKPLGICSVRCPKSWHFRTPHQRTASVLLKQLQEWPRLVDLGEFVQLPTVINSN